MKKLIILIIVFTSIQTLYSQETGRDSYTIQRLIIFNDNGDMLLQKHKNGWMTPALRHNTETTINEGLDKLASDFGLSIATPQLRGIVMYFHSDNKKPSFRQHYSCQLKSGTLKTPESMLDAKWFSPQIAIQKMLNPETKIVTAVGETTKHILNHPNSIWGGAYLLVKEEGKKTKSQIKEAFYPIGKIN